MKKLIVLFLFSASLSAQNYASRYYSYPVNTSPYSPEYQAVLDYATANGIKQPSDRVKRIQDNHMIELVQSGFYTALKNFRLPSQPNKAGAYWVMNGDTSVSKAFMSINWIDPNNYYATEINTVNFIPYNGVVSDNISGYFDPNFVFKTQDTAVIYEDFSLGAYLVNGTDDASAFADRNTLIGGSTGSGAGESQNVNLTRRGFTPPNIGAYLGGDVYQVNLRMGITSNIGAQPVLVTTHRRLDTFSLWFGNDYAAKTGNVPNSININPTIQLPSREGKIGLLANISANYTLQTDTSNPTSYTVSGFSTDTVSHLFIAPQTTDFLTALDLAIGNYNGAIGALNDTINIFTNFYHQPTDSNTVLPLLPRRNAQFGLQYQLPRGEPDSFKVYRVTNANFEGVGSLRAIIDSCENDGKHNYVLFETSGCMDTSYFQTTVINEDKFIHFIGQSAPSPGFRVHSTEINIRPGSAPLVFQHLRFGAGTDTLPGVARDSCVANCVFDSTLNKFVGWTQYSERDAIKFNSNYSIVDHCTCNFSTDELAQGRGSFQTYSNNLWTKPLSYNLHHKGGHPKGTIHFKQGVGEGQDLGIYRNLYISTTDRTPQLGGQMTGVIMENYAFNQKFGTQIVKGNPEPDDTLGGNTLIAGVRLYWDNSSSFAFRFNTGLNTSGAAYFEDFDLDGDVFPDPFAVRGSLGSNNKIIFEEGAIGSGNVWPEDAQAYIDSFFIDRPFNSFKMFDTIPRYKARKFLYTFAGARPADRDSVEKVAINEVTNKVNVDPPKNMEFWGPIIRSTPENIRPLTLPANPFSIDPTTGYMNIELWADSLHWQVTYPQSVPYQPLPAAPTGAFLFEQHNEFNIDQRLTAWRRIG